MGGAASEGAGAAVATERAVAKAVARAAAVRDAIHAKHALHATTHKANAAPAAPTRRLRVRLAAAAQPKATGAALVANVRTTGALPELNVTPPA